LHVEAMTVLSGYRWPGNIRELENVLRSVSLFSDGAEIRVQDFADYTELVRPGAAAARGPGAAKDAPTETPAENGSVREAIETPSRATGVEDGLYDRALAEGLSLKELKPRI